jgi:glycosyltransferase involved in cell wall biosynthesis
LHNFIKIIEFIKFFLITEIYFFKRRYKNHQSEYSISNGNILNYSDLVRGGKVKLLELHKYFNEDNINFNILYLVSSALPYNYKRYIKFCKKNNIKIILNQNGIAYPAWAKNKTSKINNKLRYAYLNADFIIYQSEFCRSSSLKWLGYPKVSSKILYNPINVIKFNADDEKIFKKKILISGSHQSKERVTKVLEALILLINQDKDYTLTIAGILDWDNALNEINNFLHHNNIFEYVNFIGPYKQNYAPEIYKNHDILVHIKNKDPCPTVVLEALSCGLPVVGSNSGGLSEILDNDVGILINVNDSWQQDYYPDPSEISKAIISISKNYQKYSFSAKSRSHKKFNAENWIIEHKKIFKQLLKND